MSALPETIGVFVVSGDEDFLIHVAVADNQDLYAFVIDRLTQRPEVADVRTSVVYEHLRNPRVAPPARNVPGRAVRSSAVWRRLDSSAAA